MKKGVLIAVLLAMVLLPLASAEMFISQPKGIYNAGESFSFNITLMPSTFTNSFFVAKIVCAEDNSSGEVEIYRSPQSIAAGNQKAIDVSGKFDNFLIGTLRGDCYLKVEYGDDKVKSRNFEITRGINVNVGTDKVILNPGERFNVSGKAIRDNGNVVENGFVEFRVDELGINLFKTFEGSKFNYLLDIAEDTPAGDYELHARVYEKNEQGEVTNEGDGVTALRVNQIIKKGVIAVSSQKVEPGNEFVYTILLYDQSNKEATESVEVSIYNPSGELFLNKLVNSGEANNITIAKNYLPGAWAISSKSEEIFANRTFYVNELEEISYNLINETLVVVNTGNVPYEKTIEITIGSESKLEDVYVGVGETRRYALSAPDGEYQIGVNDGETMGMIGTALLTGNAVGVEREGSFNFWRSSYIIMWMMLISFAVLIALYRYEKISKKSFVGSTPRYAAPIRLAAAPRNNVISEGTREECSIIALKLKNAEEIDRAKGSALDAVERALTRARDAKAKIYSDKGYKTMVFAPTMMKEKDNSMKAVSIAREIETTLLEHNKRFGEKVMFGLGVHNGEMIVENIDGQFKFNSIGNTMPYVKNIADTVSSSLGVSESVHRRILGKVKSDRIEGTNYWRISKIRSSGENSEFINRFVQRQRKEFSK